MSNVVLNGLSRRCCAVFFPDGCMRSIVLLAVFVLTLPCIAQGQVKGRISCGLFRSELVEGEINSLNRSAPMNTVYQGPSRFHKWYHCNSQAHGPNLKYLTGASHGIHALVSWGSRSYKRVGSVTYRGNSHTVYDAGYPGLGFIITMEGNDGRDLPVAAGSGSQNHVRITSRGPINGGSGFDYAGKADTRLYLVKTGFIPSSSGGVPLSEYPFSFYGPIKGRAVGYAWYKIGSALEQVISADTETRDHRYRIRVKSVSGGGGGGGGGGTATCNTPSIPNLFMDAVNTTDFAAPDGSVAGGKNFTMQFNSCSNLNKIRYRIKPSGGTSPNASQGLLPLKSSSLAKGLAVQLLGRLACSGNANITVVPLESWLDISTSSSSCSVPLAVRYYKLGKLSPGSVQAGMTIEFKYQ